MKRNFSVVIERDSEGWLFANVPALHGCHTQAKSFDDLLERTREVIELCLEEQHDPGGATEFVGVQQLAVEV